VLYLRDPSQHVVLYVPGEPLAAYIQFLRDAHLPSPGTIRLGTPNTPAIRFARAAYFVASLVRFRCICGAPHMQRYVAQTNMWRRDGSTSVLGGIEKSCATYL
jgi:hypothetical protein